MIEGTAPAIVLQPLPALSAILQLPDRLTEQAGSSWVSHIFVWRWPVLSSSPHPTPLKTHSSFSSWFSSLYTTRWLSCFILLLFKKSLYSVVYSTLHNVHTLQCMHCTALHSTDSTLPTSPSHLLATWLLRRDFWTVVIRLKPSELKNLTSVLLHAPPFLSH